jgi:ketosteroid isomerase-like protein
MTGAVTQSAADFDAARFVQAFADGWAGPHADRLLDLLDAHVRLVQPIFPPTTGRDAARADFFAPLVRFLPDVRLEVDRWTASGDIVMIEWTGSATLAGRPLRWSGIDRFIISGGRAIERVAYFDAVPLLVAVLRHPSCWPAFLRSGMARTWRHLFHT